ncbi:MAG: hypothetical protein RKO25_08590 [Candidatus Contendobacter sp.]|nr:hypothetical protein [Candidatus Contendobacter sp.]
MRALLLSILLLATFTTLAAAPLTFEEVDTDGDGLISADEAANVEGLDFNAADSDNDGTLSVDEYDIAVEKLSPPTGTTPPTGTGTAKPTASTPPAPVTPPPSDTKANPGKPTTPAKPVTSPADSKP